jgi:hypothetical protein
VGAVLRRCRRDELDAKLPRDNDGKSSAMVDFQMRIGALQNSAANFPTIERGDESG